MGISGTKRSTGPECRFDRISRDVPLDVSFALQIAADLVVQAISGFHAGLVGSSSADGCFSHLVGDRMIRADPELDALK